MFHLRFAQDVVKDLRGIPVFYQTRIIHAIETQLVHEPLVVTRNRKILVNLVPPWQAEPPIWELRVGDYRVFYDVQVTERIVSIRAVRLKPQGLQTEDII